MTASITINGITQAIGHHARANAEAVHINTFISGQGGGVDYTSHITDEGGRYGDYNISNNVEVWIGANHDMLAMASLTMPLDYVLQPGDFSGGQFQLSTTNIADSTTVGFAYGILLPYAIRITALPAMSSVPEPASWAFTLAGFAMIGFTIRARRGPITMKTSA